MPKPISILIIALALVLGFETRAQSPNSTDSTHSIHYYNFIKAKARIRTKHYEHIDFKTPKSTKPEKPKLPPEPSHWIIAAGLGAGYTTGQAYQPAKGGATIVGYANILSLHLANGTLMSPPTDPRKISWGWLFDFEISNILGGSFKVKEYTQPQGAGFRTSLYPIFDGTRYITNSYGGPTGTQPTVITKSEQESGGFTIMFNGRAGMRIPYGRRKFISPYLGCGLGLGQHQYVLRYAYQFSNGSTAQGQAALDVSGLCVMTNLGVVVGTYKGLYLDCNIMAMGGGFSGSAINQTTANFGVGYRFH
jgi:hypothetical protein